MKLAEALILRADCQKKIAQLRQRLSRCVKVQEGEQPPEDPQVLLGELSNAIAQLTNLIQRINRTNASTPFVRVSEAMPQAIASPQEFPGNLSDALARRDTLAIQRNALQNVVQEAALTQNRYSRSEVRLISTVDVSNLQRQVDSLAQEYRLLDTQIQSLNWQVDVLES